MDQGTKPDTNALRTRSSSSTNLESLQRKTFNKPLPSDVLLFILKELVPDQLASAREVCKQWEMVTQAKSFWQSLELDRTWSVESSRKALCQFDERNGSTLRQVKVPFYSPVEDREKSFQMIQTLERSKATLSVVWIGIAMKRRMRLMGRSGLPVVVENVVSLSSSIVDFRATVGFLERPEVEVEVATGGQDSASRSTDLKVLWIPEINSLFEEYPRLFQNLVSLKFEAFLDDNTWREILKDLSSNIRHLSINLGTRAEQGPVLKLRRLEVLELAFDRFFWFNSWMVVPSILKLKTRHLVEELPPISQLSVKDLRC